MSADDRALEKLGRAWRETPVRPRAPEEGQPCTGLTVVRPQDFNLKHQFTRMRRTREATVGKVSMFSSATAPPPHRITAVDAMLTGENPQTARQHAVESVGILLVPRRDASGQQ